MDTAVVLQVRDGLDLVARDLAAVGIGARSARDKTP
jgi:hypothetical protein